MIIKHILKDGEEVPTVKGHKLDKEKTTNILQIMEEINEKKDN